MSLEQSSALLNLPAEIRLDIYQYLPQSTAVFHPKTPQPVCPGIGNLEIYEYSIEPMKNFAKWPIFQVCRLIRNEAIQYLWSRKYFYFDICKLNDPSVKSVQRSRFFEKTCEQGMLHLRHVQIGVRVTRVLNAWTWFIEPIYYTIGLDISPDRRSIAYYTQRDHLRMWRWAKDLDDQMDPALGTTRQMLEEPETVAARPIFEKQAEPKLEHVVQLIKRSIARSVADKGDISISAAHLKVAIECVEKFFKAQDAVDFAAMNALRKLEKQTNRNGGYFVL